MRFRQSLLNTWQSCALMAHFSQVLLMPEPTRSKQLFGTYVHSALEQYNHTGDVDGALKLFSDLWRDVNPDIWDKYNTYEGLRQRGVQTIKDYASRQRWETRQIVAIEHRFLVPFGDHELSGTVDLVEIKKNHLGKNILRVCDYKTTSKKPSYAELYLNIQGSVYVYASMQKEFWLGNGVGFPPVPNGEWWYETLVDIPRRFIWYHLWTDAELDGGGRTQVDFDRVYRQCCEIEKAIKHEVFIPTISHSSCSYCAFAEGPCPVAVPKREEVMSQEDSWL